MARFLPPSASRPQPAPEMRAYRGRTRALLRRYARMSVELGRLPSIVGREYFRSDLRSARTASFEDVVIFVHDMERCLEQLNASERDLIALVIVQGYNFREAARRLRCARATLFRNLPRVLDRLSGILLEARLLAPLPCPPAHSAVGSVDDPSEAGDGEEVEEAGSCE